MTRTTRLLLAGGTLALGAAAFTGASLADGWGRHHGGGHRGAGAILLFEQFDTNEDGRVTQAEIDQARQSRLAEFDQNRDGSLSLEEYQALWMEAMRERMVDRFQAHDDDGDAVITVEEFAEPYERMVSRLDRNGDGALTPDELRPHRERGGRDGDHERNGDEDGENG